MSASVSVTSYAYVKIVVPQDMYLPGFDSAKKCELATHTCKSSQCKASSDICEKINNENVNFSR